jgi:predicted nucleic acid-binding protein
VILVDTSVWVGHLNGGDDRVADLLERRLVLMHPYVTGEIALGALRHRDRVLRELDRLEPSLVARHDDVMTLLEGQAIWSRGIGYVDLHLLASARLMTGVSIWTFDKRLAAVAGELGVGYTPPVN